MRDPVFSTPLGVVALDVLAVPRPPFLSRFGMVATAPAIDTAFEPRIRPESLEWTVLLAPAAPFSAQLLTPVLRESEFRENLDGGSATPEAVLVPAPRRALHNE
jgi:hypothetical protein